MFYCVHILYLLKLVSAFNLKLDSDFSLVSKWHYTYTISGLSEESTHPTATKTLRRIREIAAEARRDLSNDGFQADSSLEKPPLKLRQKHFQRNRNTKSPKSTNYERGTTRRANVLRDHGNNKEKRFNDLIEYDPTDTPIMRMPHPIPRAGDYVYTFVNNTVDADGKKIQQVFIYNQSHYVRYTGDVIPGDYVNLFKLWLQLKTSHQAKQFDDVFKPPYWMEWHKPPWWMDWHSPPPFALRNDTWEIWNQPGLKPPEPSVVSYMKFDLNDWLKSFWGKVQKYTSTTQKTLHRKGHGKVKFVNTNPNLWKNMNRPSVSKVIDHLKAPIVTDYVYSYVNNSVSDKGLRYQKVVLYNKTHYIVYTGDVVPSDYVGLCKLWADLKDEYEAKEFDDEFRPPWWMEWHRPPWWMEWHTPPPGMLSNNTWEIWNQPGMKPPAARNSFDWSKLFSQIWKPDHDQPISTLHRNPSAKKVFQHLQAPMAPESVYSYVNTTENGQRIILYNKTHYLHYTGKVVPRDYVGLCKLWADLKGQYNAREFDDEFKPPWWMEFHRPPWWMEWHTPPPGVFKNDTWNIFNQPGMKPPARKLVGQYPGHYGPIRQRKPRKPSVQKVVEHLKAPIVADYVYSYVNNTVNAKGERQQTVILYNKSHYLIYTGNVVPVDYNGLCKLWSDIKNQYAVKLFDEVFKPPWWMEWHRPPWWMEWHTPPPGLLANDTWEIWNQPGMKPAASARNSLDLTKWLRQLWHEIVDDNSNENSRKQQVPSTADPSWFQYGHQTPARPHGETQPHRYQMGVRTVRDDKKIYAFSKHILDSTLKLLDDVKDRTNENHWKRGVDRLARNYESKFKEYLISIKDHQIKSDQGASKVVFNAIDVSNGIVKNLVNSMVNDMGHKRTLRNSPTLNIFQKELDKELKKLLDAACANLNICKSDNGLIELLIEFLNLILDSDDEKFREAFDAGIDAFRNTALFSRIFDNNRNAKLQSRYDILSRLTIDVQRAMVLLVRNIINNRNAPLQPGEGNKLISGTIVFQDIVNEIEENVPSTAENVAEWDAIRRDINTWAKGDGPNIESIVFRFVNHIDQCINLLRRKSFDVVMNNVKKLVTIL